MTGQTDSPASSSRPTGAATAARFERTELLLGTEALARLQAAHVVVAGLGAVGSYAAEALARAGVGRLRLVDFDTVHPSNVNRQLYALGSTLGRPKAEVAAERVRDIHAGCAVEPLQLFVGPDTVGCVLAGEPDALVDAIDSVNPKVLLLREAAVRGLFTVSSMGAATRLDPSAVRVGDISETERCPLARFIRKRLRREGVPSGIRCVYSVESPRRPARPARPEPGAHGPARDVRGVARAGRPRTPLGSVSYMTGLFGLIAAGEVIRRLAGLEA